MSSQLADDAGWMRRHLRLTALVVIVLVAAIALLTFAAAHTQTTYDRMAASPLTGRDLPDKILKSGISKELIDKEREAYVRYDTSQEGVVLPPAREDRLSAKQRVAKVDRTKDKRVTCRDEPPDAGYSELCAMWASVAATSYGNRISAETYRTSALSAILGFIALVFTGIGVGIAALAARDASKAVRLVQQGMVPLLTVRPIGSKGHTVLRVVNAGTGVAKDISLSVGGSDLPMRRRVLQAGEDLQISVGRDVRGDASFEMIIRHSDLADKRIERREIFAYSDKAWHQLH